MVFLQIPEPLEIFLKRNKETRIQDIDWCLFDDSIKDRSLKNKGKNSGNLQTYENRTIYYNLYYKEPLYMYLMSEKKFKELDFFPKNKKNTTAIWNMKRIPNLINENNGYERIPTNEMLWNGTYEEQLKYVHSKFEELAKNKEDFSCVILGE